MEPRTPPPPEDLHDIKALLGKRGLTQADVGQLCEPPVSQQAVSAVLRGETVSSRIETALALACGITVGAVQNVTRGRSLRGGGGGNTGGNSESASGGRGARHRSSRRERADV